jgi:hypothetical protein
MSDPRVKPNSTSRFLPPPATASPLSPVLPELSALLLNSHSRASSPLTCSGDQSGLLLCATIRFRLLLSIGLRSPLSVTAPDPSPALRVTLIYNALSAEPLLVFTASKLSPLPLSTLLLSRTRAVRHCSMIVSTQRRAG